MAKQLIINAIEPREVRAAILENGEPSHFFVERSKRKFQKGNIYRARVTSIEPHLQAAFVELEKGQHGFLGLSDTILPDAGISLINGQPAPPLPGQEEKEEGEENKDTPKEEAEADVLLDENKTIPSKVEEKPKPVEISPSAGDMLLGLETDLNSPLIEIAKEEESPEANETTEPLIPETESSTETSKSDQGENEPQTQPDESVTPSAEQVVEASETEKPEENQSGETFLEGEEVDTAIFSIDEDDEPSEEENSEVAEEESPNNSSDDSDNKSNDQTEDVEEASSDSSESSEESSDSNKPAENKARFKPRNRQRKPYHNNRRRRPNMKIEEVLEVGQYITVQIIKEGIGNKAPMVSTYLSLAGRYMVLTPGGDRSGVSKQVRVQAERSRLKKFIDDNSIPERCGLIVRTAAEGITETDLKADMDHLSQTWEDLQKQFKKLNRPGVIKQEEALASRVVRDYYSQDIEEVWVDDKETYEEIKSVFEKGMGDQVKRLHFFEENTSIFHYYKVESAIKGLFNRKVPLPGGGSLIFDQNEAMLVIDINSGTFKEGEDDEDTAFKLNMLACKEIARQVQMRDVGGIVMVDFVDMRRLSNRSKVEKELEKSFKGDKARINIMHIGALGVLQMSRQRTKDSLRANLYSSCPHCDGTGLVPSKMHSSMGILREIRSNIKRFKGGVLKVRTTSEMALELLNNYKSELSSLEDTEGAQIQIDIDPKLSLGEFNIDTKNAPKRKSDPVKDSESANKKRRRKRNNKKKENESTPAETANNADPASNKSMTDRLERMEKEFPSDSLGIIKAPNPENDASIQNGDAKTSPKETNETGSETEAVAQSPQGESRENETQTKNEEAGSDNKQKDKTDRKPRAKKPEKTGNRRRPAPNKDQAEKTVGEAEKAPQDSETNPKPKAKTKTASKKKAATKKTSAKKTTTKTKKPAASESKSDSPVKTEE
jgi:ribonuclease E